MKREDFDAAWEEGRGHEIHFDQSVMFGMGYDFWPLENLSHTAKFSQTSFIAWPDKAGGNKKWSLYSTHDGGLWFERFPRLEVAKDAAFAELTTLIY